MYQHLILQAEQRVVVATAEMPVDVDMVAVVVEEEEEISILVHTHRTNGVSCPPKTRNMS
jgi:hypothetical protein